MDPEPKARATVEESDAGDVVAGPVGSAELKDPSTSGPIGADLEALPEIDVATSEHTG